MRGRVADTTGERVGQAGVGRPGRLPLLLAGLMALGLLAFNVWRAVTESVTHDEALTFFWYLGGPLRGVFSGFQANNHVLHTALAWCSLRTFGLSELSLRLPSLLGGALVLGSGLALLRVLIGSRWLLLAGFALLALNPLLLDFLSIARGYGLALGLMLFATLQLAHALRGAPATRLVLGSLALGLSVSANLTLAPACLGLALTALWLLPARRAGALAALLLPGAAAAAALLAGPLLAAQPGSFFIGLPTLAESSLDLVSRSIVHDVAAAPDGTWRLEAQLLAWLGLPLLLLAIAGQAARATRARRAEDRPFLLLAGALLIALLVLAALHVVAGLPWPADRTGLPLVALGSLLAAVLARDALDAPGLTLTLRLLPTLLVTVLAMQMIGQQPAHGYAPWREQAGLREVFDQIVAREAPRHTEPGRAPVRVAAADWRFEPSLNFYRLLRRAAWMAEITRDAPQRAAWDYLVAPPPSPDVPAADMPAADLSGAEVVFTEPLTGTLLLVPHEPR